VFERALSELGKPRFTRVDAARKLAVHYARRILAGDLTPYEGARRIWWDVWESCRELDDLKVFVGLASEYEDDLRNRELYSSEIIREARKLVDEHGRDTN
jgi:hypothetical protein